MPFLDAYILDPWRLAPDIAFWTVLLGTLVATACGWVGVFLILRGQALVGDAISHTALLGIVLAHLLTGQLQGWGMVVGAAITGVVTVLLIEGLPRWAEVREDAATGIVFTTLFALGVVLLGALGDSVHLDTAHVLFGDIAIALTSTVRFAGVDVPLVVLQLGVASLLLAAGLCAGWKELVVTTFDPEFAATRGLPVRGVRYGLIAMLSLLVTAAFTSVGAILVVAFLIAPGAAALLLSTRLPVVMAIVPVVGLVASLAGMHVAMGANVSTGGAMACAACGICAAAFFFAPKTGVLAYRWRQFRQRWRACEENAVRLIGRRASTGRATDWSDVRRELAWSGLWPAVVPRSLSRKGWVETRLESGAGRLGLTAAGLAEAERIERAHRLWETFLVERVGLPPDHVHPAAEDLEHTLDEPLVERVNDDLGHPERDPHGAPIPRPAMTGSGFQLAFLRAGEKGRVVANPSDAAPTSAPVDFPPGEIVEVVERNEALQTWTVRSGAGRLATFSHAQADEIWVRVEP
jgi:ABC-type Mn2+/Zn2+ transport system permease subunit/Mn-dependent DtxR family transcriptional regulator